MEEISADTTELDRFAQWGNVCIEDLDFLKEKGIDLKLYEINAEKYNLVDQDIQTILVNNDKKTVRFLIVNGGEGRPENLLPEAFEVPYPRISTTLLEEEIKKDEKEIDAIQKFFEENAKYVPAISAYKKALESDIEFENINAGMSCEKTGSENELAWLSGYVPLADLEEFTRYCADNKWAIASADPEDDDTEVPTKLKNNKFVSLIYPLTDFLGTVPGYHEFDISGWFLLFFTIFFAMIFTYRVTLPGIKGFFRLYKMDGGTTLYAFHKQMRADMEFPQDQLILFKALDAGGGVVGRYGLFDLGSGAVDAVTVA
jgi:V/A-type H+-transporting ATPase subunit I